MYIAILGKHPRVQITHMCCPKRMACNKQLD